MKTMKICSDFHLDSHFFGLARGFFVGLSVILQQNEHKVN